jgi:hypothetical protein
MPLIDFSSRRFLLCRAFLIVWLLLKFREKTVYASVNFSPALLMIFPPFVSLVFTSNHFFFSKSWKIWLLLEFISRKFFRPIYRASIQLEHTCPWHFNRFLFLRKSRNAAFTSAREKNQRKNIKSNQKKIHLISFFPPAVFPPTQSELRRRRETQTDFFFFQLL